MTLKIVLPLGRCLEPIFGLLKSAGFAVSQGKKPGEIVSHDSGLFFAARDPWLIPRLLVDGDYDAGMCPSYIIRNAAIDVGCTFKEVCDLGLHSETIALVDLMVDPKTYQDRQFTVATQCGGLVQEWANKVGKDVRILETRRPLSCIPEEADMALIRLSGHYKEDVSSRGLRVSKVLMESTMHLWVATGATETKKRACWAFGDAIAMHTGIRRWVGAIIHDYETGLFLFQQKSMDHRNPASRGRFSFFGGRMNTEETPAGALRRELGSELPSIHGGLMLVASPWKTFTLKAPEDSDRYEANLFVAKVTREMFDHYVNEISRFGGVKEGAFIRMDTAQFFEVISESEEKQQFLGSLHNAAKIFLQEHVL